MSPDVTGDVIAACGIAGLALAAATLFIPTRQIQEEPAPPTGPSPVVWRACHHPACGHLETRHDPTPVGFACRACTQRTEAS